MTADIINLRRRVRAKVDQSITVVNMLSKEDIGCLVNVHEEGFMVIGGGDIRENCLYQLLLKLSEPVEGKQEISVGAECLWTRETNSGDQLWYGFHIVDLAEHDLATLRLLSSFE